MSEITTSIEKITPAQAGLWLEKNFERQRPRRKWQVDFLAEQMHRGRFQPTAAIGIAHLNGSAFIVNGQHTLAAITESGKTQYLPVVRHIVEDENELDDIYAHYDIGIKRSFTDSVRTYRVAEQADLTDFYVNKLASAIRFIEGDFGGRTPRYAHEDLIARVLDWRDEFASIRDCISPCSNDIRNRIMSRAILSVALVTRRFQPEAAIEFWSQVARDDGLERGDPRKALNKKLLMISSLVGSGIGSQNVLVPGIQSRIAAHAWNKWRNGLSLIVIKESMFQGNEPIEIDGTPYE